ncbi:hypothetical protein ACQPZJ_18360 [Actinoplanes sp. CA-054009]
MTEPDDRVVPRLHDLWLRLAGRAPDDVTSVARRWLAEGRITEVAQAALVAALGSGAPVRPEDAALLVQALPGVPETAGLAGLGTVPDLAPRFDFGPVLPGPYDQGARPLVLDLTRPGTEPLDRADAAAVAGLEQVALPVALWRAWRSPQPDRIAAGPVRVYLLETRAEGPRLSEAAAWLQECLTAAGIPDPQVEVFRSGEPLPAYQRTARGRSALLWAEQPPAPVTVARVFDSYDPVLGGQFEVDHPVLADGDEPARVLAWLEAGTALMSTTAREADAFDPEAGPVVPVSFRTDGHWIWTDAVAYYLRTYALSPDAELLAWMRDNDFRAPEAGSVAVHRALATLTGAADDEGDNHG